MEKSTRTRSASVLLNDFLKLALGVSDKAASNVAGQIQKDGELATMKQHVREIKGEAFTQINSGLTKLKKQIDKMDKGDSEEDVAYDDQPGDGPKGNNDGDGLDKKDDKDDGSKSKSDKKDVKEGYSFISHLLTELDVRNIAQQELDASGEKEDRMTRARQSPTALKMQRTQELKTQQQSKDPIDQKILSLRSQIAVLQKKRAAQQQGGIT